MGHATASALDAYARLQERLDRLPTGAPDSPAFQEILRRLFMPEEAEIATAIPNICSLANLANKLGRDEQELGAVISGMARRGLVVDLEHRGHRWVRLSPVVIGLFEFTMMRVADDADVRPLAALFQRYGSEVPDHALAHAIWQGSVQIGRSLVREEALPAEACAEVLDWERATRIVASAGTVAVGTCSCRREARLLGGGCDAPLRTCLTFGADADALARAGLVETITNDEALGILAQAKAAGLVQIADNVQGGVGYMCNCCGCCCGMLGAVRDAGIVDAVVPSNFVAATDFDRCRGCTLCFCACPVDAITMVDTNGKDPRIYWSIVDPDRCIGCGVCFPVCRWGGRAMAPRPQRAFTPANRLEREAVMALERGKLGDFLADAMEGLGPRAVSATLRVLAQRDPTEARRAIEPLGSVYLDEFLTYTARAG
jgi:Fe-S-cluster-containing hydrogenase component 2